jgi:hypothetical protein
MRATHKFFKHKNGKSAFAVVGIEAVPADEVTITWSPELAFAEKEYSPAVTEGINKAIRWHSERGGGLSTFTITEFTELYVDTKPDAVSCAAAAAAWKALGHDETLLNFEFQENWIVSVWVEPNTYESH